MHCNLYRACASTDASGVLKNAQVKPDEDYDWAVGYQGALRSIPLAAGAMGICGVLANRVVSGVSAWMLCLASLAPLSDAALSAVPAWDLGRVV